MNDERKRENQSIDRDALKVLLNEPQPLNSLFLDEQSERVVWSEYGDGIRIAAVQLPGFDSRVDFVYPSDTILLLELFPDHMGNNSERTVHLNRHDLQLENLLTEIRGLSDIVADNLWLMFIGYPSTAHHLHMLLSRNSFRDIKRYVMSGMDLPLMIAEITARLYETGNVPKDKQLHLHTEGEREDGNGSEEEVPAVHTADIINGPLQDDHFDRIPVFILHLVAVRIPGNRSGLDRGE